MGNELRQFVRLWTICPIALIVAVLITAPANAANGENQFVEFPVTNFMGDTITLTGKLTQPEGDGPFPAVVLLHGCNGVEYDDGTFMSSMGYVALQIDSFGPRGITNVCDGSDRFKAGPRVRARDAHAGKDYLASLPYVNGDRIAVIGWSHGGMTVLQAVGNKAINEPVRPRPFRAAIAFYPRCPLTLPRLDAPLLVLIGDADDWTLAEHCRLMTLEGDTTHEYQLIVYPGATHAFAWEVEPWEYLGHKGRYDPAATADAYKRVFEFLERHLR
jgi:dienelactone hydrolase